MIQFLNSISQESTVNDDIRYAIEQCPDYADDVQVIEIWAHGSANGMRVQTSGFGYMEITTAEQFDAFLSSESEVWKSKKEEDKIAIVLHSCNTGNEEIEGANIAQVFSSSPLFQNTIIIAPSETVVINPADCVEKGPMKSILTSAGVHVPVLDASGMNIKGRWNIYQGGVKLGSWYYATVYNPGVFNSPRILFEKYTKK